MMVSAPVAFLPEILETGEEVVQPEPVDLRVLARDQLLRIVCRHGSLMLRRTGREMISWGVLAAVVRTCRSETIGQIWTGTGRRVSVRMSGQVGAPVGSGAWPFVGRERELAAIASARTIPECCGAVVVASAGVGKSRLAREASARAEAEGALAVWVQATTSSTAIPLGALAGLIPDEVGSGDGVQLMQRTSQALRDRAGGRRIVLAVDDAQWLDDASAALVQHLATADEVFVMATVREGLPSPDAIDALWKDLTAHRMELERLSDEVIADLMEAGLGGPVERATLRQLLDASAGNPLFARELVLAAVGAGVLTVERGLWGLRGQPSVPPSLIAVITRRMGRLSREERETLELLALGEPLRVQELVDLTSLELVETVEDRGMVTIGGPAADAEVRVAHPLYGEVLVAELPVLRSRSLRLRLATAIQLREPLMPDDALRAARLLLDAGEPIPAGLLEDAAAAANLAGDAELGAQLAQQAIHSGGGLRASVLLARAHVMRDRYAEAEQLLAAAESRVPGDPIAGEYLMKRLNVLSLGLRQAADARALLERAQNWSGDAAWPKIMEAAQMFVEGLANGFAGSAERAGALLADPTLDPAWRRQLEIMHLRRLFTIGRAKEANELAWRQRPFAPLRGSTDIWALGHTWLVGLETGENWAELEEYAVELLRGAIRAGDREAAGLAALVLGALDLERGCYQDAWRWLAEAETQLDHSDMLDATAAVRTLQVVAAHATGAVEVANTALESLRSPASGRPPGFVQRVYAPLAEGASARALSEAAGAERFMRDAAEAQEPTMRARLLYEAMRAGARPKDVAVQLAETADGCDSRLVAARAAHAAARLAHDGQALLAAGDELAAVGAQVAAMEAAVDAARKFVSEGRTDSARRAASVAHERYVPDQGAGFPIIDGLEGVATQLSPREAQIAGLAARGLTNQEIADQLVLSVRTAETYVYRAMQKRGVSNRREL